MSGFASTMLLAALSIGVIHTVLGPDHYLPFIALARARRWNQKKTLAITALCGGGHILSSIVLGGIGLAAGAGLAQLQTIQAVRGDWAAWMLVVLGAAYALWGVRVAIRKHHGLEPHAHHGSVHLHRHGGVEHVHAHRSIDSQVTFWTLFITFVLGPCEPLIPLFMAPAGRGRWDLAALVAGIYGVATIACMLIVTALGLAGVRRLPFGLLERWVHAMAGGVIAASGLAIICLGI
jgi:nickel/cobalt transporter (NicO) family protein